jgi:hypothetical protein
VLALVQASEAVHVVTSTSEQCHSHANGSQWCENHLSTTITLLPQGQETKLISKSQAHQSVGAVITLTSVAETLQCIKRTRGHAFDYRIGVETSLRCPGMGTCEAHKCAALKNSDSVEEMKEWQSHNGWNFCKASTCEGLRCLPDAACGHPTKSACIVGRVYAIAIGNTTIEWFDCPVWKPTLQVVAKIETDTRWSQSTLQLAPGNTVKWENFSLTLFPGGRSPSPIGNGLPCAPLFFHTRMDVSKCKGSAIRVCKGRIPRTQCARLFGHYPYTYV